MPSNIIILTTPKTYTPVYNIVELCAKEQDATSILEPNYKFVIDIVTQIHGTFRFSVSPEPILKYGTLDFSRTIDQFIKEEIIPHNVNGGFIPGQTECVLQYTIEVLSAWNVADIFTIDPDGVGPVSTGNLYVWNAAFEHHDWIGQMNTASPFNTWIANITNGVSAKFLTPQPNKKVKIGDLGWSFILTDTFGDIDQMEILTYDSAGALIDTYIVLNNLGAPVSAFLMGVASAPQSLNNITPGLITTGAQPIITADIASYTIQVQNLAGTPSTELITMTVEPDCRYDTYRIHFLNKLGGFDAYNFTFRSQPSTKMSRKTYTKSETKIVTAGIAYNQKDNGKTDYIVRYQGKIKLRSEYLTESEHQWLEELISSPIVYLEFVDFDGARNFKPVHVITGKWEDKITSIDKLFRLDIDIDLGHESIRQRR